MKKKKSRKEKKCTEVPQKLPLQLMTKEQLEEFDKPKKEEDGWIEFKF